MSEFAFSKYCNKKLFETFPELRNLDVKPPMKFSPRTYQEIIEDALKDPKYGAHGIYEDAFCPYVLDLIKKNDKESRKKVKKAFELIEELVQHENYDVRCLAEVGFIEGFICKLQPTKDVERYLLPKSLEAAREIANEYLIFNPQTWEEEQLRRY